MDKFTCTLTHEEIAQRLDLIMGAHFTLFQQAKELRNLRHELIGHNESRKVVSIVVGIDGAHLEPLPRWPV